MTRHIRTIIFILFLGCTANSRAQNIADLYHLDTIIDSKIRVDYSSFREDNYLMKIWGNDLFIFTPTWVDNDTFCLIKINLVTHKTKKINIYFPGASYRFIYPSAKDMAINGKYLVLLSITKSLVCFKRKGDDFIFDFTSPLPTKYNYSTLLNGNLLLLAKLYDIHPLDDPEKTDFQLFNLDRQTIVAGDTPVFNGIFFTHFAPSHFVDGMDSSVLFAQTVNYKIDLLDSKLKTKGTITSNEEWTVADTALLRKYEMAGADRNPKNYIDSVSPMEDSVSRIEAIYGLNDTEILVRKIPDHNKEKNRLRLVDIWKKDNAEWVLEYHNLLDDSPDKKTVIDLKKYPLGSCYGNNLYKGRYFVKFSASYTMPKSGITFAELDNRENGSFGKETPTYKIYIYKR